MIVEDVQVINKRIRTSVLKMALHGFRSLDMGGREEYSQRNIARGSLSISAIRRMSLQIEVHKSCGRYA